MTYEQYETAGIKFINFTVHQYDDWGNVIVGIASGNSSFKIDSPYEMARKIQEKIDILNRSIFQVPLNKIDNMKRLKKSLENAIKKADIISDNDYEYGKYSKELSQILHNRD